MKHAERKGNGMRLKSKVNAARPIYAIMQIWINCINWKDRMHE
jgi:hypothetical protein